MNVADEILTLKDDFDAVYEAGKKAGGGAEITEPYAIYRGLSGANYEECETFNMTSIPVNFIRQNTGVKRVIINEGVTILQNAAIFSCTNLTSVTLPSTLKTINANALGGNSKLNNVLIPKNVISIQATSFLNCSGLINIDVESEFAGDLYLNTCANVSQESVSNIITHYDNGSGKKLVLHADVFANVPASEITRANEKGLTIAQA